MHPFDPFPCPPDPWPAVDRPDAAPTGDTKPEHPAESDRGAPAPFPDGCLDPLFLDELDEILLTQSAYQHGRDYFAARQPEAACLLLGPRDDSLVTHLLADETGIATPASFTLDARTLNRRVRPFLAAGLDIKGVWHLHPAGVAALSAGDLAYAAKLFGNPRHRALDRFLMPVTADGRCHGFVLARDGRRLLVRRARLVLV